MPLFCVVTLYLKEPQYFLLKFCRCLCDDVILDCHLRFFFLLSHSLSLLSIKVRCICALSCICAPSFSVGILQLNLFQYCFVTFFVCSCDIALLVRYPLFAFCTPQIVLFLADDFVPFANRESCTLKVSRH